MPRRNPVAWFGGRVATGLKELPSNAAWVAGKARRPPAKVLSTTSSRVPYRVCTAPPPLGEPLQVTGRRPRPCPRNSSTTATGTNTRPEAPAASVYRSRQHELTYYNPALPRQAGAV